MDKKPVQPTIVALATALPAATLTLRISGERTEHLLDKCFFSAQKKQHRLLRIGQINIGGIKDTATAVLFKAPKSFTGEDMAEITIHGSPILAQQLMLFLIKNGAKTAEKGEFSRRAFLNNKLDLSSAEGILDLIDAESEAELKSAYDHMTGGLKTQIDETQSEILTASAALEAVLDFPDEDITEENAIAVALELRRIAKKLTALKNTYKSGRMIKNGIKIAIIGGTNVGKSSLINALLQKPRAIVTDTPGTTRDTLEDTFTHDGQKFVITDTAGIRETSDTVESIGIERAKAAAKSSDIILAVFEAGSELSDEVKDLIISAEKEVILVENKIDILPPSRAGAHRISARTGEGVEELKQLIFDLMLGEACAEQSNDGEQNIKIGGSECLCEPIKDGNNESLAKSNKDRNKNNKTEAKCEKSAIYNKESKNGIILTELRHFDAVSEAAEILNNSAENIFATPPDCLAADLSFAYNLLGSITGRSGSDELIDQIFSKFCVGK